MSETEIRYKPVRVPLWWRLWCNARPSQAWHFLYCLNYFWWEHCSFLDALDVAWCIWWTVREDWGCMDDEHPLWPRQMTEVRP